MSTICSFADLQQEVKTLPQRVRVAVCQGADEHTFHAVTTAIEMGFVDAIMVSDHRPDHLDQVAPHVLQHLSFVDATSADDAARQAVTLVHEGSADILMKGLINTDDLLRHVLNKEYGLRLPGSVITHVAVFENAVFSGRLGIVTDSAVIPQPTLEQRTAQLRYAASVARSLGIEQPRVALLHFCEKTSEKFPITLDYAQLKAEAAAGTFGSIIVDGPLDFLCAISHNALAQKNLSSPLEGKADVLMVPDIEAGNMLYKTLQFFSDSEGSAGLICGTSHPIVLTSRGDSVETKVNSLALAALQVRSLS